MKRFLHTVSALCASSAGFFAACPSVAGIFAACLSASFVFASCAPENGFVEPLELGVAEKSVRLPADEGQFSLKVLSDGVFTARVVEGEWLRFSGSGLQALNASGDCELGLSYESNSGMSRTATVVLERGRRSVEVLFTQAGVLSEEISFAQGGIELGSSEGTAAVRVKTLFKDSELDISVEYDSGEGWIPDINKIGDQISFSVSENRSPQSRTARLELYCRDNPAISDALHVFQSGSGAESVPLTFQELRNMLGEAGSLKLDGNYVVEGIVSGDNSEGNGGENRNISANIQDRSYAGRTVYLQSEDGSLGFRIILDSPQDNIVSRYDHLKLLLRGAELVRRDNPARYDIQSVGSGNIIALTPGSPSDIYSKNRSIADLRDEDIYTFVTLENCEIPIRKGPFVPIDLRHTQLIHSYPMVLLDKNGDRTHLITNLGASWERDGRGMPQGSGPVSGVVVHENCDNFEWNQDEMYRRMQEGVSAAYITDLGEIGRYQIRPFTRSEIALNEEFEDGFSGMLMEIRYYNRNNDEIVRNFDGESLFSTWPAVAEPMADASVKGCLQVVDGSGKAGNMLVWRDWTHLGPMENGEITDRGRGNGVLDYYGVNTEWEPYVSVATTALIMKSSAWYSSSGWKSLDKAWTATFSTEGLTESNLPLSVQFGAFNGLGQSIGAPRRWRLEYSVDGREWTAVEDYTVPDFPVLSNRKAWQCPGPKYISITLPRDSRLLGRDEVMVRLRPYADKAGNADSYDGGTIVGGKETAMNYFAIRYNK